MTICHVKIKTIYKLRLLMQVKPPSYSTTGSFLGRFFKTKPRLTLSLGLLACAIAAPFVAKAQNGSDTNNKNEVRVLSNNELESLNQLRTYQEGVDLKEIEKSWAKKVWPLIHPLLTAMYRAEREDNVALRAGKITEQQRQVKIFYSDFVLPGEEGHDEGSELNLHVVKHFDYKLSNGNKLRIYVNEHWPINLETGGILPTETLRIMAQVKEGDLTKPGAEDLMAGDLLLLVWGDNADGRLPGGNLSIIFHRQHLYDDFNGKENPENDILVKVSSPFDCRRCHNSRSTLTQDLFLKAPEKRTNFAAITPDSAFEMVDPKNEGNIRYHDHPGVIKYLRYLTDKVEKGELTRKQFDAVKADLMDSTAMENPSIVEALEKDDGISWLEADRVVNPGDTTSEGYTYTRGGKTYERRAAETYRNDLYGDTWWHRKNLQLIPRR